MRGGAYECSTAGFVCPGTTTHTVVKQICNGGCWVSCNSDTPFTSETVVAKLCTDWGGRLAPIRTVEDQTCVHTMLFPSQASWIGFEQVAGQAFTNTGWSWNSDGIVPTYTNWSPGQPNDLDGLEDGTKQCAYMTTIGEWQDTVCTGTTMYRFSCRHD